MRGWQMIATNTNRTGGELYDAALVQEIELLAELIDAVTRAGRPLSDSEIDHALNVERSEDEAHAAA
jgi:hypothetical protein